MYNTEVKRNSATHFDLSFEITDPDTIKTMVGDNVETFKNSKPAVNQEFVQNSQKLNNAKIFARLFYNQKIDIKVLTSKDFMFQKIVKVKGFAGDSEL